ncbi:MAG: oligosaccharide flippase family protein [Ferruginibacter sp.]|nr:oligosaccharide flippase family protein [Ferruginibacter sp.]
MLQNIKFFLFKNPFKQVGIYTISGSLCKAISFAALPFFVNTLSEGDIGILNIFSNCIVFLTPIISMGVLYTISIDYFKLSKENYAKVFSTSLIIPAVLSLLLLPVLYIFRSPLEKNLSFQHDFFWLIPLCLFFNFCFEAFVILMRNQNHVRQFTIVSLLKILLEIALSIGFILFIYQNWYGRALGFLLSGVVIGTLFFIYIKKHDFLVKINDYTILRKELYFGLSGLVLQTAIFFIGTSDKFFVMFFFGKVQAGYYAVAATFATIQYIICISLLQYLQPVLFTKFEALQNWKNLKNVYYKYILAMFTTWTGVMVFTFVVYNFVLKAAYKEYVYFFYILSVSSFVWTISNIFLQFIIFNKSKRIIFLLSVIAIFFSITVNYITSKYLDIDWLGFGQIVTNIFVLLLILFFNKKLNYFA